VSPRCDGRPSVPHLGSPEGECGAGYVALHEKTLFTLLTLCEACSLRGLDIICYLFA
jgi:hypothetical protein